MWTTVIAIALAIYLLTEIIPLTIPEPPGKTGREGLIGATGLAKTDIGPNGGKIFLQGAIWNAASVTPIDKGNWVQVDKVKGLVLIVSLTERDDVT